MQLEGNDGCSIELIEGEPSQPYARWDASPIPAQHQIRGFHGATAWVRDARPTARLLTHILGLEKLDEGGNRARVGLAGRPAGTSLDLVEDSSLPAAQPGRGSIHHLVWRVPDKRPKSPPGSASHKPDSPLRRSLPANIFDPSTFAMATDCCLELPPTYPVSPQTAKPWKRLERACSSPRNMSPGTGRSRRHCPRFATRP